MSVPDAFTQAGQAVFRFAPSPNGPLHRGHARSAILNAALAQREKGRFLVRIEDIDHERSWPDFIAAIESDLQWLGLQWEQPMRHQSHHMDDYQSALTKLRDQHVVYPCFCSRGERNERVAQAERSGASWPRDPDGAPLYDRFCCTLTDDDRAARLATGLPHQWRLGTRRALALVGPLHWYAFHPKDRHVILIKADPLRWGDPVIARKDVPTSYHLSVVVDDALQGVTHIVRGVDLEAATDIHALLQALLHLPQPLYWHHPLLYDAAGQKLSKSRLSPSLASERAQGITPDEFWRDALSLISS